MANFTPRMPSEDEDFDAILAPKRARKPRTPRPQTNPQYKIAAAKPQEAAYAQEESQPGPEPVSEPEVQHRAPEYVEPFNQPTSRSVVVTAPEVEEAEATVDEPVTEAPKQVVENKSQPTAKRSRRLNVHLLVEFLMLAALLGLGLWTWQLYTDRKALKSQVASLEANPQIAVQRQTDSLIQHVGNLITLPAGETPTIANVSDAAKAKEQSAFFANAQNGDKVLMYVKAGEAILYRPSTDKIILVAPLTFNSAATDTATTP